MQHISTPFRAGFVRWIWRLLPVLSIVGKLSQNAYILGASDGNVWIIGMLSVEISEIGAYLFRAHWRMLLQDTSLSRQLSLQHRQLPKRIAGPIRTFSGCYWHVNYPMTTFGLGLQPASYWHAVATDKKQRNRYIPVFVPTCFILVKVASVAL